jgi:hypothetical protein
MVLDRAWIQKLPLNRGTRARIHSVAGASAALGAVFSRNYLADLDKVSGGTGWEIIEVADPVVRQVGEGVILNVKASLVPGTLWAELHVEGAAARPPKLERKGRVRAKSHADIELDGKKATKVEATARWVTLDLPEEDSDSWEHLVTVPIGKPVLLNAFPVEGASGSTRVLLAWVHVFGIDGDDAKGQE